MKARRVFRGEPAGNVQAWTITKRPEPGQGGFARARPCRYAGSRWRRQRQDAPLTVMVADSLVSQRSCPGRPPADKAPGATVRPDAALQLASLLTLIPK